LHQKINRLIDYLLPAKFPLLGEKAPDSVPIEARLKKVCQRPLNTLNRQSEAGVLPPAPFAAATRPATESKGAEKTSFSAEEPWIMDPKEFSAPPAAADAFPGKAPGEGRLTFSGFLGKAVGKVHESVEFWKETFENDPYVMKILREGYQIPVKMTSAKRSTRYRERNNQSARNEMDFVRKEVARLVEGGQVIKVDSPPTCVNPLSVAFKVNGDGSIKKRLVIDLSHG
jgi:hypothetical protein